MLMNKSSKEMKILVQRADKLGDVILSTPVIEALRTHYPHAKIDILTSKIGEDYCDGHEQINKIYSIDLSLSFLKKMTYIIKLIQNIRKENYSLYISVWNRPILSYIGWLSKIPIRVGDSSNPTLKWLFTHKIKQSWCDFTRHQAEFNLELLKSLKLPVLKMKRKVYIESNSQEWAKELIKTVKQKIKK